MHIIGLTGGIGSGKSTVAEMLVAHGARLVDADRVAREIVEPGEPALAELAREFTGILRPDGSLDRAELARQAFATPEATARLNAVTHPRIRERTRALFDRARDDGVAVLVYDMPLLIENGETGSVDTVLVVDAPDELRLRRLVDGRGLDEADARARIRAQVDRETRLAAADRVLDNSGTREDLSRQVDAFWADLAD
ncbi:dephospho-CoA kinase [Corynebacterium bovis]|uniref:Dephospho-CoA kinase n=1 Tax=Corynebacterium bovis DSM 20582 = CIP 54.80 TaxID=927655 RepID=A0A8H9Y9A9_9CORY|nr:dephospho-CoA kinase [Corynebacterium bovis]MBB3115117.1 dephospho-CoA kinase [Corynebacterium bovis DSM 20582 = CIP 54.80]QQC47912.1 dephospho-CoA kinase [Corynebacterium bovis]RRO81567.1 dephospho-CoA kinase [Corynebacterium bovis]RRO82846.1 dephospho-CoA kinase [Corynebacterium bovis]RRO83735.1 dephospho-CoA kinase [Corynebacterium bovis]